MIPLSRLTAAEQVTLYDTLTVPHSSRITGRLMTLDHETVADLPVILGGSVDHQTDGHAVSSASVDVLDVDHGLGLDAPGLTGQVRLDRLLRVEQEIDVPGLGWVSVPLHTGRVVRPVRRESGVLTLECHGKEVLADRPAWGQPRTWRAGTRTTSIIRALAAMWGEHPSRIGIPDWPDRTAEEVGVGPLTSMWGRAQGLAKGLGAHLFYDAFGIVRLRRYSTEPVITLTDYANRPSRTVGGREVGAYLLSEPEIAYAAYGDYVNAVWVRGKRLANGERPSFAAYAPSWHPLAPRNSLMGGKPDYRVESIEDDTLRTWAQVEAVARRRMDRIAMDFADADVECLPVPGLEPEDVIAVSTTAGHLRLRMKTWTYPLDGGPMRIGTQSRIVRRRPRRAR